MTTPAFAATKIKPAIAGPIARGMHVFIEAL